MANTKEQLEKRIKELEEENNELKQRLGNTKKNERGAGRKKKTTEDMELEIQKLHYFGTSMDALAKKFKLSKGTIFKIISSE